MFTILLIAISLSLDSFVTSISLSIKNKKKNIQTALTVSFVFALFQTVLPLAGYIIGSSLGFIISRIDHWIAFVLLTGVGVKFIFESYEKENCKKIQHLNLKTMCLLGLATSIDAFVIGITFAFIPVKIIYILLVIWFVTFFITFLGFFVGGKMPYGNSKKIEIVGGFLLIGIGLKILLNHLFLF